MAHLGVAKLALQELEWVLDIGADTRLDFFSRPIRAARRFFPLSSALRLPGRIAKDFDFLALRQAVYFGDVGHVARDAVHGVHQARMCVHSNMCLHPKIIIACLSGLNASRGHMLGLCSWWSRAQQSRWRLPQYVT